LVLGRNGGTKLVAPLIRSAKFPRVSAFFSSTSTYSSPSSSYSSSTSSLSVPLSRSFFSGQSLVKSTSSPFAPQFSRTYFSSPSSSSSSSSSAFAKVAPFLAIASVAGVGAVVYEASKHALPSEQVKRRLKQTYGYVVGGLSVSALTAISLARSGIAFRIMAANPWVMLGVSTIGCIAVSSLCRAIPYENTVAKHAAFLGFTTLIGATLSPLCLLGASFLGTTILTDAAIGTAIVFGSLSAIAAAAPDDKFLSWGGPLTIGLGGVLAASVGRMFFPAMGALEMISLYGGLMVFGGFVLHDTSVIRRHAAVLPDSRYDPINEGIHIYLTVINLFTTLVQILANNKKNK